MASTGSIRPRVGIVRQCDLYEPGIQREAEALVDLGFDVEVICMRHPDRPRRAVVNGVDVISLPSSRKKGSKPQYLVDYAEFFVLTAATLTVHHLRRPYAAVQVNTMPDFLVFAATGPKLLGSKVVAYMHEPSPELAATLFGSNRLISLLQRIEQRALRFADHSITVTEQLKQRFVERGASAEGITVVLNCADPKQLVTGSSASPRPNQVFKIACHGSIEDRYGQDTIVEAASLLRELLPDLRVVFTGRGSGVNDLLRSVQDLGLEDVVRYEGFVTPGRLNEILGSADVGIVAQKASPYSHLVQTNKMMDYWICGLPVIASRLDSVSGMYGDEVIEYYTPGDARSLAAAIRRLHDDGGRRAELAGNGARAHEAHGWAVQQLIYRGVYETLISGSPARAPSLSSR